MTELLSVKAAQEILLRKFHSLGVEKLHVTNIFERVLAEDIISPIDLPAFSNSSMDGFGVRVDDFLRPGDDKQISLRVIGEIPAGDIYLGDIQSGEAVRIFTGAMIPEGVDAVIPVELTEQNFVIQDNKPVEYISFQQIVNPGDYIRKIGDDLKRGDFLLAKGRIIRPQDIGLLSMLGIKEIKVYAKARVGVFSTGNELINPVDNLSPGKIYDSNRPMIISLLEQAGADVLDYGIISDNEDDIISLLDELHSRSVDLILTSGGVSVGSYDYVRKVIETNGQLEFWRVNIRPGKPIAFGYYQETPIIGLPGNPVSAFIGYLVFVAPVLAKMSNRELNSHKRCQVRLSSPITSDGRETYFRARIVPRENELYAELTGEQGSGNLNSLVQADALLVIPAGVTSLPEGSQVEAWIFDEIIAC